MIYLVLFVLIFPLWHSVVTLSETHLNKEPLWLKVYIVSAYFYLAIVLIACTKFVLTKFDASSSIQGYAMGAMGLIVTIIAAKTLPKQKNDSWD